MNRIRVLIVDDHALFRDALRALLERYDDLEIVGEADDADQGLELVSTTKPDVVLLDLQLPGRGGLEVIPEILALQPDARVVALTMYQEDSFITAALDAGAAGYIHKDERSTVLLNGIRTVATGGAAVAPNTVRRLLRQAQPAAEKPLLQRPNDHGITRREITILELLAQARSNRDIAEVLYLSEQTIKNELSTLYQKLGVARRDRAVIRARELGLIPRSN